jgi:thiamine kinase-like enzyme
MKSRFPSTRMLVSRLSQMLDVNESMDGPVEIVDRSPEPNSSTFPVEIVTCRVAKGDPVTLLCKYSRPGQARLPAWHVSHGHRHGVGYEALVYRHVLEPLRMTTPRLWGTYESGDEGWLAIEYLRDCVRVKSAPEEIDRVADWIGQFHARNQRRLREPALTFVSRYSADYYRGWAQRTVAYARKHRRDCRKVEAVCDAFEEGIEALLTPPLTIIHGELYPSNVLYRSGSIHPVDWESAAIGAGEIDLVALTEQWPAEDVERCQRAYVRARWPSGDVDTGFERRVWAARLYLLLRWTGTPRAWSTRGARSHYLLRLEDEWAQLNVRSRVDRASAASV